MEALCVPQGAEECPHGCVLHEGLNACLQYQHLGCDGAAGLMSAEEEGRGSRVSGVRREARGTG